MKRIYTRTGDKGTTGIHGGERVPKDDIRIEANGCLDELNALIGVVRSLLKPEHEWNGLLYDIQRNLMVVMSLVATPSAIRHNNPNTLDENIVTDIEHKLDEFSSEVEELGFFILPGGTVVSAQLQLARTVARRAERRLWTLNRTVARRAERRLWTLNRKDAVPEDILKYVNRLSDLFFVMAKLEMQKQNWPEERWNLFAYKRKGVKESRRNICFSEVLSFF